MWLQLEKQSLMNNPFWKGLVTQTPVRTNLCEGDRTDIVGEDPVWWVVSTPPPDWVAAHLGTIDALVNEEQLGWPLPDLASPFLEIVGLSGEKEKHKTDLWASGVWDRLFPWALPIRRWVMNWEQHAFPGGKEVYHWSPPPLVSGQSSWRCHGGAATLHRSASDCLANRLSHWLWLADNPPPKDKGGRLPPSDIWTEYPLVDSHMLWWSCCLSSLGHVGPVIVCWNEPEPSESFCALTNWCCGTPPSGTRSSIPFPPLNRLLSPTARHGEDSVNWDSHTHSLGKPVQCQPPKQAVFEILG